ncbi:MAG TPA: beta-eliminating lyase-related protein [Mycobacteriales bacterium]|nr:beta-eliminating lyase-related protein [Mycobacteriales bacterium]
MTSLSTDPVATCLRDLTPPVTSFASDNHSGAHPSVMAAVAAANVGPAAAYGGDAWTARCEAAFAELFDRPVAVALTFGGTGANVVALHTLCGRDSSIICTTDAHIALDEAGAPEHITGAQLLGYQWDGHGKLTPEHVHDAAARFDRVHIQDVVDIRNVVSVTQATEVGTVYSPDELAAVCEAAHRYQMAVHVDGARLANALVAWGYGAGQLGDACQRLAECGVDVIAFGGTKAGLLGAEAVVFPDPALAGPVAQRRKQATQTSSKMRFLAAQFLAALSAGAILDWSTNANRTAQSLASTVVATPGAALAYPTDANAVFATLPRAAISALEGWTPFHTWDPARDLVRFVTAWDTTDADIEALAAGIRIACAAALDEG